MNNVKLHLRKAIEKLNDFYSFFNSTERKIALACDYFRWVRHKTQMIIEEDTFQEPKAADIKRGSVCWIHFGFNVGEELGGKQPGIVLRKGGKNHCSCPVNNQTANTKAIGQWNLC